MKKGLLMVFTGNGKGKTTAALGQAFRALGHGFKVCVIQFIKGSWKYGEMAAAEKFKGLLEFHVMGKGFTWASKDIEQDTRAAKEAWIFAKEAIGSGKFEMVVLDELTYPMNYGMLDAEEVLKALTSRPGSVHVVVTGRDAPKGLIDAADLVTEMVDVKHHYDSGIEAQKGVEF
ncbi:MAG: cob(I)yrinic acid a,c-diamide adenosyltransferase [Desulfomonile tiedjei]|nr:cob(I)yrinic acid a,c-diamide adenosyltransferase [Desulfomonile tiedjei]